MYLRSHKNSDSLKSRKNSDSSLDLVCVCLFACCGSAPVHLRSHKNSDSLRSHKNSDRTGVGMCLCVSARLLACQLDLKTCRGFEFFALLTALLPAWVNLLSALLKWKLTCMLTCKLTDAQPREELPPEYPDTS